MPREPEDTKFPVPQGGGIDDSTDEFLRTPPHAAAVDNMHSRKAGSYRKRPGWSLLHTQTTITAPVVVGNESTCLFMGDTPAKVVSTSDAVDTALPSPLPLTVSRVPVLAGKGFVHSVQATSSASYTCVVMSQVGNVGVDGAAGAENHQEMDYEVVGVILNDKDQIVWGPHTFPAKLKWLPRVEAVDDGDFVVFAAGSDAYATELSNVFLTTNPEMYASYCSVSGGAPTVATSLGTLWESKGTAAKVYKLYDTATTYTSGSPGDALCVFPRSSTGKKLEFVSSDDGTIKNSSTQTVTGTGNDHIACWWDATSTTFLVHEADDNKLWYDDHTFGSPASITTAVLLGIDAATSYDERIGPHEATPVFYEDSDGQIYLNEREIGITGSAPGTPSLGTTNDELLPQLFQPFNLGTQVIYSHASQGYAKKAFGFGHWRQGAGSVELYHMGTHDFFSKEKPCVDATLGESRLGDHNHSMYTFLTYLDPAGGQEHPERTAAQTAFAESPCVTGQWAELGDGVSFPLPVLTSQQNARGSALTAPDVQGGYGGAVDNTGSDGEKTGVMGDGAGWYNDEQIVTLARVVSGSPVVSRHSHEGSVVVSHGGVSAWTSDLVTPLALRAPVLTDVTGIAEGGLGDNTGGSPAAGRRITKGALGLNGGATAAGAYYYRAVLVYTDPTGLEFRSPPSEPRLASGDPNLELYAPVVHIEPFPSTLAFLGTGRALDVELYITDRTGATVATEADIDTSTYAMVCRMPLQHDSSGYYVVDTIQDFVKYDADPGAGTDYQNPYQNPPWTQALYTLSGEKPPDWLPACHVMASAGEYLMALSAEDPYEVWVSKPRVKGRAPEFSSSLTLLLPPESGGCVSLAGTYDRMYALCKRGVWELPAIGGFDNTGAGSFPPWRLLYEGDPCVTHMGTVRCPAGVFYVSDSGPRLISQGGDQGDIGAKVEDRLADWSTVNDASHVPARNEIVWFHGSGGVSLDLRRGSWATHDRSALASALLGSDLIRLDASGDVVRQVDSVATDNGSTYLGEVRTPWINLGDIQGFKRAVEVTVLGRLENTPTIGQLRVYIRYNYDDTTIDTFTWTATELLALSRGLQLRVKPTRQKCDAIQIGVLEVVETQGQSTASDIDWTLANIEIRIRAKAGLSKVEQGASK